MVISFEILSFRTLNVLNSHSRQNSLGPKYFVLLFILQTHWIFKYYNWRHLKIGPIRKLHNSDGIVLHPKQTSFNFIQANGFIFIRHTHTNTEWLFVCTFDHTIKMVPNRNLHTTLQMLWSFYYFNIQSTVSFANLMWHWNYCWYWTANFWY